jgi:hypothetical protein
MKKSIFTSLVFLVFLTNLTFAQTGAFRIKNGAAMNIGYSNYRFLTFGEGSTNANDGPYALEYWDDGLNFWTPFSSGLSGSIQSTNYRFFLSNNGKCGINMRPDNVNSTSLNWNTNALQVRGYTQSHGYWTWSDSSLKSNIQKIDNALDKLIQLSPVSYTYKNSDLSGIKTTDANNAKNATLQAERTRNQADNSQVKRFGLIAQDVEKIFPNLVSTFEGSPSVNYLELVPILIGSIKEQQKTIEVLKQKVLDLESKTVYTDVNATKLFQNTPNPFKGLTVFTYFIDEATVFSSAVIEIRDIMGILKATLPLSDKSGLGKVSYNAENLSDGYYIYSLKIDNNLKDSKMMLISE